RVLQTIVVPPNHWTNYRSIPQPQSGDSLVYQWDGTVRANSSKVWFDVDSNALRAPASWKIQYLDADGTWKDVTNPSAYTTTTGKANPNAVTFDAVTTTALKLDMTGQAVDGGYASVAVAEWEVGSDSSESPAITAPKSVTTATGTAPTLPATVDVKYGNPTVASPVIWRPVDASSYAKVGSFTAYGVVAGVPGEASEQGNVSVNVTVQDGYQPAADTTKPTVTVAVTANAGNSEWLTTAPFATVQATDDTAPIAKLEISADQGKSWTTIAANANAAIATLSQQGDVEVWARATDQAGNVSDVAKAGGKVDSAAPTVTAAADKEERTLTLTADDGTGSGVASIEYRIGTDGQWATYSKPIAAPSASRATVYYRATDKAGNVSASAKTDIPSDTSVPLTGYIEGDATATDVDGKASGWVKGAAALNDGKIIPDITIANEDVWGTWPNTGEMRLDYEWDREVTIDSSRVQFTSDDGGLGIPASWELQYWDALANNGAGNFVDISDATYTVTANSPSAGWATGDAKGWSDGTWNTPVKTTKLRMVITSGSASPAVAEWQVHAIDDSTPEPPEPTPIDKTELKQALADSPKADDASKYTETSWAEYAAVLDSAQQVYKAEDATEAAVVDAATQLKQAAKKLVLVATVQDRAALSAQLDAAAAVDRTKWTDESLAVLDSAVATANALTSDGQAAQSDVQAATEAISDAIAGLVEKSTTKPGQGGDKPGSGTDKPNQGNDSNQNKGDADSGKHKKIPDTGAAVLGVGILAVVLAVAGVIILKRRKSGTC
ncbi:Ig-like domain-containing protein, partial [Bifidobacterium longum]